MIDVVASARGAYDAGLQTLTFALPALAIKGDALCAFVVHASTSSITVPDGWSDVATLTAGGLTARMLSRMVDDHEDAAIVVALTAAGDEVQGELVALRGAGTMPLLLEASAASAFAATTTPGSPAVSSLQAVNLAVELWSSSGLPTLTAPAGDAAIDAYSSSIVAARSLLVASRRVNATGAIALGAATASVNATGASFAFVLRASLPLQPLDLFDPVPGNIGFLGKDNRPPREAA